MKPFDLVRGAFLLVAAVVVTAMILSIISAVACVYVIVAGIAMGEKVCTQLGLRDFILGLMATLLILLNLKPPTTGPPKDPPA